MSSLAEKPDRPSGRRKYTPREREGFFRALERAGSVAAAAAELGFNLSTCHRWARAAGIPGRPGGPLHPGREEFFRLRASGVSRKGAAAAAGIHPRTAGRWEAQSLPPKLLGRQARCQSFGECEGRGGQVLREIPDAAHDRFWPYLRRSWTVIHSQAPHS